MLIHHLADITGPHAALTNQSPASDLAAGSKRKDAIRSALLAARRPDVQEALVLENQRLRAALTTMAASRGLFGMRDRLVDRRRQLWQRAGGKLGAADWAGWVSALCGEVVACLPEIDAAAVSVGSGPSQGVVAATTRWADQLEQLHYALGEGPAVTAYHNRFPVLVPDLSRQQQHWPGYVQAAASVVTGVFVLPLLLDGEAIGTLSLYARTFEAMAPARWSDAVIVADLMTSALMIDLDTSPVDQAVTGLGMLNQVSVAAGMLANARWITVDQATALLRARAFTQNRQIVDVADDVINRRFPFDE